MCCTRSEVKLVLGKTDDVITHRCDQVLGKMPVEPGPVAGAWSLTGLRGPEIVFLQAQLR